MKTFKYLALIAAFITTSTSCKKITSIETDAIASVNTVNVVNGANAIWINKNNTNIPVNGYSIQGVDAGDASVKAYDITTKAVYYNQAQTMVNGGLYSLYLTGTVAAPEGVWIKDNIKAYGSDNTITTVRIANMSPGAGPVNVTLASATGTNVFSNVSYKSVTAFQDFAMPLSVPTGTTTFQFKDATNAIIATFTLPDGARNRSYTIVLKGQTGSISAIGQQHY